MSFGEALVVLKRGGNVARKGWNGKNMHIYLEDTFVFPVCAGVYSGTSRKYEPCIVMLTAQGAHQPGWLASQADLLAEDWVEVTP